MIDERRFPLTSGLWAHRDTHWTSTRSLKNLFDFRTKLANWLTDASEWLIRQADKPGDGKRFVDLAPTDKADPSGVYSGALTEATSNPRVMNIALTGPYGSGKSSIIKSFLKRYKRRALLISLASFLPEAEPTNAKVSKQEIERSILQQMLYGADANRLPLSRFKRIQSPSRWSILVSFSMMISLAAGWYLIQKREALIKGTYFIPFDLTNWFNFLALAIVCAFSWLTIHHIYVASFGISLKSISLKDIEITPKSTNEESILNRHLDEIIYFFQSTKYDLVVIEDLDRFNNPDIFVTLREINSLINANAGVKRTVRFLYALRDDMFVNTDRTKFFEFLIPVIPIINSSNSIDKVLEQGKRLSIDSRLHPQFLREASRYLNDLRLIQNIFNEYAIYSSNLETDGEENLDANKLLAVLIYKNVFPSDFENLHRGKGNLAHILRSHDRYITSIEARWTDEISRLEGLIDLGEKQLPNDLGELRRIYAMAVIEQVPANHCDISTDRSSFIPMSTLSTSERLEQFLEATRIFARQPNGGYHQQLPAFDAQKSVHPTKTFQQRKDEIERKSASFKDSTSKSIRNIRSKLSAVRMMKFHEIIRENAKDLDDLFARFGEGAELARFLVLEGYLDDTYYQYTSLFHSGRLSPSDHKFLLRIRGFNNPDPDFHIDNSKEVITAMREEDFSRDYALNVKIVDCLLADPAAYATQIRKLYEFIAAHFDECEKFFSAYYTRGAAVPKLVDGLARTWPGFIQTAMASQSALMHVARAMSHLPDPQLKALAGKHPTLSGFISSALPAILDLGIDFAPDRLKILDVEIANLPDLEAYPGIMRVIFGDGLYKISVENLNFIFNSILDIGDDARPNVQNYTLILELGSAPLLAKVDGRFSEYLEEVLLRLPDNHSESAEAIQHVIERNDVEFDSVVSFLRQQKTPIPTLDQVPVNLHAVLFEIGKIEPTWENCLSFLGSESYNADFLTEFLNRETTSAAIARHTVPDGVTAAPLRKFIIENDGLSDEVYATYVNSLPRNFNLFPSDISLEKTKILVDQNRINFSPANLSHLSDTPSLGVKFVTSNLDQFFETEQDCDIDDDFREALLEANLTDEDRLKILRSMDLSLLGGMPLRAAVVGRILARTGILIDNLGEDGARAIIVNSRPLDVQISLFNMLHEKFGEQQVREILQALPPPFPDIKPGWAMPRIAGNDVNQTFVTWLKTRGFISSWKRGSFFDDDIRINLFRK